MSNVKAKDALVEIRKGLTNSRIKGANNTTIRREGFTTKMLNEIVEQNSISSLINNDKGGS